MKRAASQNQETADMVARIVEYLRDRETYQESEVMAQFQVDGGAGRRAIWSALQVLRETLAIEFVPVGSSGEFRRATVEQRLRRGQAFGRSIRRKKARQIAIYEAAVSVTTDADLRRRLESAASKASDEYMVLETFAAQARKPKPPGI